MRLLLVVVILVLCQAATMGADMKIAILRDSFPVKASFADPDKLAGVLRQAQNAQDGVEFVTADQLADPKAFNAEKYWLVVLPYGEYFPIEARDNFLAYLRAGGDFLSTGGYAFDGLALRWKGQWLTKEDALALIPTRDLRVGGEGDLGYLTGQWHSSEEAQEEWGDAKGMKRWSGKNAGLKLTVDPAEHYTLELSVSANPRAERFHRRVLVNGKRMLDIPTGLGQVLKIPLGPKDFGGKRQLDLVFDCELWRPCDLSDSPDTRELGIGVSRVRLMSDKPVEPGPDISGLSKYMNMRHGKMKDFLEWEKEQIGVFDAGYRLTGGKSVSPAEDQHIVPTTFSVKGKIEGWAAAGTTGSGWYWTEPTHRSRLIPLLATSDEFGRFRGNAGSLMVNTLEPYRGSIWAYFGVESRDILSEPGGDELLISVVNAMRRGVFLHDLHSTYACYRQGEEVVVEGSVSNMSGEKRSCLAQIAVSDEPGAPVHFDSIQVELAPGESKQISTKWRPGAFKDDFYTVKADLVIDGRPVDTLRTGFYAWNEQTIAKGMDLSYSDNFLRDGGKPRYMLGVQAFYDKTCPAGMDPLDIERDFRDMADMGLHVSRVFTYNDTEQDWRFRDAMAMASQRHRVVFWLSNTVYARAYLDNPEMVSIPHKISERYSGVDGMMIDLYNEPNFSNVQDAARDARFSEWLRAKYGSDEALRAAWGDELGKDEKLGSMKMGWLKKDWLSIRSRDVYRFLLWQGNKWVTDMTGAIKEKDPSRLVGVGYLQSWSGMVMDPSLTSDALDFIDRHWYNTMDEIRAFDSGLAMSDRRYRGKAPSIGEFGSKTYPTFAETGHNYDTVERQELRYLHIGHYTLGLGGIFASNWIWRDPRSCIFPYGIVYSDSTPKPVTKAYRAMSMLFSGMRPKYVEPEVYLVLPDESRIGGGSERIVEGARRALNGLIDARLRFGVINEWDLARLPKSAKLLVLPAPFALSEPAYQKLREYVTGGGVLYVSGDISYDEDRRRTKTSRLEELAGVKCVEQRYPDVRFETTARERISYGGGVAYMGNPSMRIEPTAGAAVIARCASGPVAVMNRLGKGAVLFSSDPAEFGADNPLGAIYLRAANEAGVHCEQVSPDTKGVQVFRLPCDDGEAVMVGNIGDKAVRVSVTAGGREYSVFVAANRQAMLVTKGEKLVGLEAQGPVSRDGAAVATANRHFFAVALDGYDIAESREIAMVGLGAGKYAMGRPGLAAEAGEVRGGRWHALRKLGAGVSVPESLAGEIVLLAMQDGLEHARDAVAGLLAR